eukprot:SAG22_NODE_13639_length_399_cov_1.723333_2_plen_32_part_01
MANTFWDVSLQRVKPNKYQVKNLRIDDDDDDG